MIFQKQIMRFLRSWRILKLSRISQGQHGCVGPVILAWSTQDSKCKHTNTCFTPGARQNNRLLLSETSHLGRVFSLSLLKYSTEEKDYSSKEAIVTENLNNDVFDNNELKSCGVVAKEGQKAGLTLDDNNGYCEGSVVSPTVDDRIGIKDRTVSSSVWDENEQELLTEEDEEEDDIEDFIDYGYTLDDDDNDPDIPIYTPPIELKRGTTGVFDLEDLLTVLEHENGIDICVIDVPPSKNYVDNMVIVSGKSARHLRSMAENVKWLYKQKKHKSDPFVNIEGRNTNNWMAMDLGNIALHIFLPQLREKYDLETLWTVGDVDEDSNLELDDPYAMRSMPLMNEEVVQDKDANNLTPEHEIDNNSSSSSKIQNLSTKH